MVKKIAILMFGLSLITSACTQRADTVTFAGSISNAGEIAVTRVEDINRKKIELVGRIAVKSDGMFSESFENLEPHLYELNFPNGKKLQFVSDGKADLEFKGDAQKPEEITVSGFGDNDNLLSYEKFRKESLERLVLSVRKQLKALPEKGGPEFERLGKLEVTNYEEHKRELLDFVKREMGTSLAIYATSTRWPAESALVEPVVTTFANAHPDLAITERLKERLAVIKQTSVGGTAPDIKMRDGSGEEISLYSSKGKYTLIDFWGSWCGPCRREADTLASLYQEHKGKGFEIFGVGLESEMRLWKEARERDRRVWPNVLSLKEFDTEAAFDYAVASLPANFLIDENGKVIAKDLHDDELRKKLAELFDGK